MARFTIPDAPNTYTHAITDLLGVDYNDTVVDNRRSPKMVNLVNNNGFLESRFGHKILINVGEGNINGVWNIDANNEIFVVHCGTNLYEVTSDFKNKVIITTGLEDVKSTGLYLNDQLVILDGKRALLYHKVGDDWVVDYLDEVGYIPTTVISRKPNGTGGTKYEGVNLCNPYRKNSFLSDGTSIEYKLDGETWAEETPTVTKLTAEGTLVAVPVSSWDYVTGTVRFDSPIEESPVKGRDNVFIQFKSGDVVCYINGCTFGTLYGYAGNNNRLFVSGNKEFPNIDWHSAIDDPTYFSADDYAKIGVRPITGYSRTTTGALATQKRLSDTDCTVYERTFNTMNGMQIFPLAAGVKNIGCLNNACCANFLNDPVFLSENGVYGLTNGSLSSINERFAEERSYYINKQLLEEENLEDAVAIVNGYRYYLAVNNHCYVADRRFLSNSDFSESNYQYEWFYFDNMPVRVFFNWNNKLYFGDNEGNIRTFRENYVDEFTEVSDKNMLPNDAENKVVNGVTITVNEDKSITFNGTATGSIFYYLTKDRYFTIEPGEYMLSFHKKGSASGGIYCSFYNQHNTQTLVKDVPLTIYNQYKVTALEDTIIRSTFIYVAKDAVLTDFTIYPMLEKGTSVSEYIPYQKKVIVEKPFEVYYETPYLYFNNYVNAKTIRRLYVHTVPDVETSIKLSYETPDEKTVVSTITYDGVNKFPKVMQEKEKISKIMCCKLIIEGLEKIRCSFNTIIAEYRIAGKYRGE